MRMTKRWQTLAKRMVAEQIAARGVRDPRVLAAMQQIPRHLFAPAASLEEAYGDFPLPIGHGQTISQPFIVAYMTEGLQLRGDEKVLEIGTGSGYQAAVLGLLAHEVHTVERIPALAEAARRRLTELGYTNVTVHLSDGTLGLPQHAPYDAILVTAAAPKVPRPLLEQLADGGRLLAPVGDRGFQRLERWTRLGNIWQRQVMESVAFVPLIGQHGWPENT